MKKTFAMILMMMVMTAFILFPAPAGAGTSDVTLMWDESIDAPYLASYRVFYYTISNNPESLTADKYAAAYQLADGVSHPIAATDPRSITIPKTNTQITLKGLKDGKYYFVLTAIDTRGLESIPTPEISTTLDTQPPAYPKNLRIINIKITIETKTGNIVVTTTTGQ